MRRTDGLDAGATGDEAGSGNVFTRDFKYLDDECEESAARERARVLDPLPLFFLMVHVICGAALITSLVGSPILIPVTALLGGLVIADGVIAILSARRRPSSLLSHQATRGAALYAFVQSSTWCAVSVLAAGQGAMSTLTSMAIVGGLFAAQLAFLSFPALVLLTGVVGVATAQILWGGPESAVVTGLFSLALLRLSATGATDNRKQLGRRLAMDWSAQRANRFIEEFEQAGRGWFWETTGRGALSYVSDQLAADLKTPAAELIGKSFTDLIGIDESADAETSERTLGFHLSARLPFTDVTVRAKTAAEIWWSLSGTPSFDEHGRFLGFRGIGSDLTQQRRSEQEINRLAKYDSLTGLPNRALMRRTLDEALQTKSAASSGCALFLIDLDRFKNVNDTLGHPVGDALLKQVAQRLTSVGSPGTELEFAL